MVPRGGPFDAHTVSMAALPDVTIANGVESGGVRLRDPDGHRLRTLDARTDAVASPRPLLEGRLASASYDAWGAAASASATRAGAACGRSIPARRSYVPAAAAGGPPR